MPSLATPSPTPCSEAVFNWIPYPYAIGYDVYRSTTSISGTQLVDPIKLNTSPIRTRPPRQPFQRA